MFIVITKGQKDQKSEEIIAVCHIFMSTPLGGGHIIFAFSGVRRPSRLVSAHFKEKYLSYVYQIWYEQ